MHSPDLGRRSIDLHAHTTASDGDLAPTDLIREAAAIGLSAIAVTDHDTTAGIEEAVRAGASLGIRVVPGIELSAEIDRGQCHILGLLIDPANEPLLARLHEVIDNRNTRNTRIVAKMRNELGIDISIEEVEAIAGGDVVARPHFARVLMNKGHVTSMQEAFDTYLAKGAKAYVDRDRLTQQESIDLIHGAGGLAILAHPNNLKLDAAETEAEIARMQQFGLDGIEARYNKHTPEDTARYLDMAARLGLLTGGGSDFHGKSVKPNVFLGHVEHASAEAIGVAGGAIPAPDHLLSALDSARTTR